MADAAALALSGSPAKGVAGVAYTFTPTTTGGDSTAIAWTATGLPAGLSIDATTGVVSGKPTAVGTAAAVITATQSGTATTLDASIEITAGLALGGTAPSAILGVAYSFTPTVTGGDGTAITWSVDGLPAGMDFDKTTGAVSGASTAVGTATPVFSAEQSGVTATLDATIKVYPAVTLSGTPATADVGTAYHFTPTVSNEADGGTLAVTLASGTLPAGMTLDPATGTVAGTATAAGSSTFTLSVTDGTSTSTTEFTVVVQQAYAIATTTLPTAPLDVSYSVSLSTLGGSSTATTTWSVTDGELPLGLTLSTAGVISGTALEEGEYIFAVTAMSSDGETATSDLTIDVQDTGAAEAEGKTPQQVHLETSLNAFAAILVGVETPTAGQLTNAASALSAATEVLLATTTQGMMDSAATFVRANSNLFNIGNLPNVVAVLPVNQRRQTQTLWSAFYATVVTPEIPTNVTGIIRDCRRMSIAMYLNQLRLSA